MAPDRSESTAQSDVSFADWPPCGLEGRASAELVELLAVADAQAARAVQDARGAIAAAVDLLVAGWRRGGRLIYVGAGTSGRLGVLDAAEWPPTFGVDPARVVAVIAGGHEALVRSIEGAEDDEGEGAHQMRELDLGEHDMVVGLSASGSTPFTVAALRQAAASGAATAAVTVVAESALARAAQLLIVVDVGAELVDGSSRMKAGTAQKLVCNALSTAAQIRLGRVLDRHMVGVQLTNRKLRARAFGILLSLGAAPSETAAEELLAAAGDDLPTALLMGCANVDRAAASACLESAGGHVPRALSAAKTAGEVNAKTSTTTGEVR